MSWYNGTTRLPKTCSNLCLSTRRLWARASSCIHHKRWNIPFSSWLCKFSFNCDKIKLFNTARQLPPLIFPSKTYGPNNSTPITTTTSVLMRYPDRLRQAIFALICSRHFSRSYESSRLKPYRSRSFFTHSSHDFLGRPFLLLTFWREYLFQM